MFIAQLPDARQKARFGQDAAHVAHHRLQYQGRYLILIVGQQHLHGREVVVGGRQRIGGRGFGDARRVGHAHRNGSAAGCNQERITVAVVAAFKLDDFVAARETPCHADGRHGGLRTRVNHANFFDRRHHADNQLSHLDFLAGGGAKGKRVLNRVAHGPLNRFKGVPQNHRPPRVDQFDVLLPVFVVDIRPFGGLNKKWRPTHRPKRPHRRVDTTGNQSFGPFKKLFARRHFRMIESLMES